MRGGLPASLLSGDTFAYRANIAFLSSQYQPPTNDVEKDVVSELCLQLLEAAMKHPAK